MERLKKWRVVNRRAHFLRTEIHAAGIQAIEYLEHALVALWRQLLNYDASNCPKIKIVSSLVERLIVQPVQWIPFFICNRRKYEIEPLKELIFLEHCIGRYSAVFIDESSKFGPPFLPWESG